MQSMRRVVRVKQMALQRFIVCGDSYSEGMSDEIIDHKYRGWADRVADVMANTADGQIAWLMSWQTHMLISRI